MQIRELRPMFWTGQLDETIAFYRGLLGFTLNEYNESWGWASLSRDDVGVMLARPNAHIPFEKPLFTGSVYFNVDDVDAWWERLKNQVKLVYPIENFDWEMREFAVYDPNGYILQFGSPIQKRKTADGA